LPRGDRQLSRNLQTEILTFVEQLPYWQQVLAAHILGLIDSDEAEVLDNAYSHLLSEHGLSKAVEKQELSFPQGSKVKDSKVLGPLRLVAIKDFVNVNAIRAGQCLPIAKRGLTALGGLNGSGKSSIGRLINAVFYSRGDDEIIPNIFQPADGQPASAVFVFEKEDGSVFELKYVNDGNHHSPEFQQFASFDTKCVNVHLNDENELHVAPHGFSFFRELANLTNRVIQRFGDEISKLPITNPFIELLDGDSDVKTFITSLDAKAEEREVRERLTLQEGDPAETAILAKQIAELNLDAIEARRKNLTSVQAQLNSLKLRLDTNETQLGSESFKVFEEGIQRINELNKLIQEKGAEKFKSSGIKNVGTLEWKTFIQDAQKLAHSQHPKYPTLGDKCLFCTQELEAAAIAHIQGYWEFLASTAETQLNAVKATLRGKVTSLSALNLALPDETSAVAVWLSKNALSEYEGIKAALSSQKQVRDTLVTAVSNLRWTQPVPIPKASLQGLLDNVGKELLETDTKALGQKKAALEQQLANLNHKKKCSEKLSAIQDWLAKRKWQKKASEIKNAMSTRSITDVGKRLFDEHVTARYRQTFHQECVDLNARFQLELTQVGRGGKSHRKYEIEGYPPGKILSEGEQRAVSLADFITELKISNINSGWVFDDPVNSQDVERKELIAKKLVTEAKERQVVVFSHDITFLYDLNNWSTRLGVPFKCNWVERQGLDAGIIYENVPPNFEGAYINPDKAEKKLVEARSPDLDPMERENRLKEGFSCLRTSYEAFVVQDMLAKVVTRFDRRLGYDSINRIYAPTKWKNHVLQKLKELSGHIEGHSHSDINYTPIGPDLLQREIEDFKKMKTEFRTDRKSEGAAGNAQGSSLNSPVEN
jgi:hypothetical protein